MDILLVYLCRFEVRFPGILLRGFSWQREFGKLVWPKPHFPAFLGVATPRICLRGPPSIAAGGVHHPVCLSFCVTPLLMTFSRWCRNVDLLSIAYAFRPWLRDRLTLSGLTLLRKP